MSLLKILFLADEIPQSKHAGSIQFFRLLENYPSDKLLVVGRKPTEGAQVLDCRYIELSFPFFDRWRVTRFNRLLADGEALGIIQYRLPFSIQKSIDEFNPDVVVTLMQLYMYYQTAFDYAKRKGKPLVLFCHDDVESFSNVHDLCKIKLVSRNRRIYRYAFKRFCISPQMVEAWKIKYGVDGSVMYPVPSNKIKPRLLQESTKLKVSNRLTIGFAGSMAYGYAEGIREIIPALEETDSLLKIYNNPSSILPIDISYSLEFCGYATTPEETWERIKAECDAVILPYSFDLKFKELYETHFPSKLPEYLLLGMPFVINGPDYATGVKFGKVNSNSVLTSYDRDSLKFTGIINMLKSEDNLRLQLASLSVDLAKQYFSTYDFINLINGSGIGNI